MKRIAVIPNNSKDIGLVNTKRLVEFLNGKAEIYIDEAYSVLGLNVNYVAENEILDNAEYLIVLGGDGTILQRAAECAKRKIPVLGINLGKIGFMTEIEIDDMEDAISKFLQDDFTVEKRMMMKAEIRKENKIQFSFHALNDVVVSKVAGEKLIYRELSTDGVAVNRYTADGLIIATPTGSTAYSLSAGGPIVLPTSNLFVLTPICAQTLTTARSIVLPDNAYIRLIVEAKDGIRMLHQAVSFDSDNVVSVHPGDEIVIKSASDKVRLIRLDKRSFLDTLGKKLSR